MAASYLGPPARPPSPEVRQWTPRPKLRSARDVLHRLRWDESFADDTYIVGYEDRFRGVLEVALADWLDEQTEEDFIPQHRILYFRRQSDGERIWDKHEKLDLVFGSGFKREQKEVEVEGADDEEEEEMEADGKEGSEEAEDKEKRRRGEPSDGEKGSDKKA
ncbi:MAG: hypothetical protein M1826_002677 [Phylliscum demangeonii]|nr:MAG: hypothetical protein M1826_002677 [Phylliscum demangeonii]